MNNKNNYKKYVPVALKRYFHNLKNQLELRSLAREDYRRFYRYAVVSGSTMNAENYRSQIMYFTHQIEKGLSHKNFRSGFGKKAIADLVKAMKNLQHFPNYEKDDFYQNAISALNQYRIKHEGITDRTPHFELIPQDILAELQHSNVHTSGVKVIRRADKTENERISFKELALNRSSIRDFKPDVSIPDADLEEALHISLKTPSVCNRQSVRVVVVKDKELIREVLSLQGGFRGYSLPDKLLIITSNLSYFLRPQERNQAQIDGGLFAMSVLYSLEYKQIAACSLSANISRPKINRIREIAGIQDCEAVIMFIACGIMDDEVKSPISYRTTYDQIVREL